MSVSSTESKMITTVGRTRMASGIPIGSGLGGDSFFHQPDHVVAQIAEHPGRHGRQAVGQHEPAFVDEGAQRRQRRLAAGLERLAVLARGAVDLGRVGACAPHHVGIEPDDRVAPAHRAALDGFEEKAQRLVGAGLEKGRDRGFEVGDQRGPHDLGGAACIGCRECAGGRLDLHGRNWALNTMYSMYSTCGRRPGRRRPD